MRKRTTTQQLHNALSNNLMTIERIESYNKTTRQTDVISIDTFKDSLDFLYETIFADSVGWHYEKNHKTDDYEIEMGRMDGNSDVIITAYFRKNDGVTDQDIKDVLLKIEEGE